MQRTSATGGQLLPSGLLVAKKKVLRAPECKDVGGSVKQRCKSLVF